MVRRGWAVTSLLLLAALCGIRADDKEKRTSMKIIDVGSRQTSNIALTALEIEDPIALPGAPVRLKAQIRNDTTAPIAGAQVRYFNQTATLSDCGGYFPAILEIVMVSPFIDPVTSTVSPARVFNDANF